MGSSAHCHRSLLLPVQGTLLPTVLQDLAPAIAEGPILARCPCYARRCGRSLLFETLPPPASAMPPLPALSVSLLSQPGRAARGRREAQPSPDVAPPNILRPSPLLRSLVLPPFIYPFNNYLWSTNRMPNDVRDPEDTDTWPLCLPSAPTSSLLLSGPSTFWKGVASLCKSFFVRQNSPLPSKTKPKCHLRCNTLSTSHPPMPQYGEQTRGDGAHRFMSKLFFVVSLSNTL